MKFDDQHIIEYLEGHLDEAQVHSFEEALRRDELLNERFQTYTLIKDALTHAHEEDLRKNFNVWESEMGQTKARPKDAPRIQISKRWLSLAASIFAFAIVITILYNSLMKPANLFATYYSEPIPNITREAGNEEVSINFSNALTHYAAGDFAKAISGFEGVDKVDKRYEEAQLLLLDSHVKEKDWASALNRSEDLLNSDSLSPISRDKLDWFHLLVLLRSGEKEQSLLELDKILADPEHLFYLRAGELEADL